MTYDEAVDCIQGVSEFVLKTQKNTQNIDQRVRLAALYVLLRDSLYNLNELAQTEKRGHEGPSLPCF